MTIEFPHQPPTGMYYEILPFKTNVVAIWIHYRRRFDYNNGKPVACIWGFYNTKTGKFYSPLNPKKVGKEVDISKTTSYSAMVPLNIL